MIPPLPGAVGSEGGRQSWGLCSPRLGHSPRVGRTRRCSALLCDPGRSAHATHFPRRAGPGGAEPGKLRPWPAPNTHPASWELERGCEAGPGLGSPGSLTSSLKAGRPFGAVGRLIRARRPETGADTDQRQPRTSPWPGCGEMPSLGPAPGLQGGISTI